jgi:predicted GIY-YIG superfamily endonuclease
LPLAGEEPAVRQCNEQNFLRLHPGQPFSNALTGVTNELERRVIERRHGRVSGFNAQYKIFRLVHFEMFVDIAVAIAREKEIKGWRREKKIRLIESQESNLD